MGNEAVDTEKTSKLITRAGSTPSLQAITGRLPGMYALTCCLLPMTTRSMQRLM